MGEGLRRALRTVGQGPPKIKIRRGAVIRVMKTPKDTWEITQIPEVEGAFVALDPRDGSIRALVGGFDFNKNKFNHATQAWRQPGSGFKPFIYSAALEKGFPHTIVNDAPLFFDSGVTGGQPWGRRTTTASSRARCRCTRRWPSPRTWCRSGAAGGGCPERAGLDQPLRLRGREAQAYLTMALGAGAVTPMQMALGYRCSPMAATASIPG